MHKKTKKIVLLALSLFLVLAVGFFAFAEHEHSREEVRVPAAAPSIKNESLTLVAGGTTVELSFRAGDTLETILRSAGASDKLALSGREYSGLGFFITDIGTLHAGGGKSLLYFINGTEASVGVSAYTPSSGDQILWKLE